MKPTTIFKLPTVYFTQVMLSKIMLQFQVSSIENSLLLVVMKWFVYPKPDVFVSLLAGLANLTVYPWNRCNYDIGRSLGYKVVFHQHTQRDFQKDRYSSSF